MKDCSVDELVKNFVGLYFFVFVGVVLIRIDDVLVVIKLVVG